MRIKRLSRHLREIVIRYVIIMQCRIIKECKPKRKEIKKYRIIKGFVGIIKKRVSTTKGELVQTSYLMVDQIRK